MLASVLSVWLNDSGRELTPERSSTQQSNSSQSVIGNNQAPKITDERKNDVTPRIEREPERPNLWITYAWEDNEGGDFDFLVQELESVGINVVFDKVALVPGERLWEQIAENIESPTLDGWAYLLTEQSLNSNACMEELAYALDRAINSKGQDFPLLGLLHGVRIEDVPAALRVRLAVSLDDPNWTDQVKAGLEGHPPQSTVPKQTRYSWQIHRSWKGSPTLTAVEVHPRFGEIMYWRFAVPAGTSVPQFGHGPSDSASFSLALNDYRTGTIEIDGVACEWYGASNRLSAGISGYLVIGGELPDFVFFGTATEVGGFPSQGETANLK